MTATGWRTLAVWAAVGFLFGFLVARLTWLARGEVSSVPWSAALVLGAAGAALVFTGVRTKHRLERKTGTKPLPPLVGARLAALALAASRVGAGVGGGYLGYGAFVLADLSTDSARSCCCARPVRPRSGRRGGRRLAAGARPAPAGGHRPDPARHHLTGRSPPGGLGTRLWG